MPASFSQRKGIVPIQKKFQIDNADEDLRNGLWNCMWTIILSKVTGSTFLSRDDLPGNFARNYWENYRKLTIDTLPRHWQNITGEIRHIFLQQGWNEMYDIIEFIVANFDLGNKENDEFRKCFNFVSEKEFSSYRLVGNNITEITSTEEIKEIEEALQSPVDAVKVHLESSIGKLSDKINPDYRNSIKESISAVEVICKKITGDSDTTMGKALEEIETKGIIELHTDMKDAFKKLYHYTSDADGIRHSLMEGKTGADFDDAKFMLVSCSAIVNYLISKANKAGINLT